jgi:uncharacterized membrane protein YozB (DUF420 family)
VRAGLFSRATPATELELVLGLLIVALLLAGLRQAWRGRRGSHILTMRAAAGLMLAFLLLFLAGAARRGGVEALGQAAAGPAFMGLLVLHVALSLAGGVLLVRQVWTGWGASRRGSGPPDGHRRWGGFVAGFWLVNGLLGALVFLLAYVL